MCVGGLFGGRQQQQAIAAPAPIQPRNPDLAQASRLPSKKELLDPDDVAGVEYGTSAKKEDQRGNAARTGTDALKININTGAGGGGTSGGLNV
tara:strand:- start:3013 stop:3291 length:279 start_codon:yes stop_codon:yes gene_type:complete